MSESSAPAKRALMDLDSPVTSPIKSQSTSYLPTRIIPTSSKKFPTDDNGAYKMKDDVFISMQTLIIFIEQLQKEISILQTSQQKIQSDVDRLLTKMDAPDSPSFADVASRNLPRVTTSSQVLITRKALQEEGTAESRKAQLFLKDLPETGNDKDAIFKLFNPASLPPLPNEVFRLGKSRIPGSPPRPTILVFATHSDALHFLKQFNLIRHTMDGNRMSCRFHYCSSDLELYRQAWSEAITKNNVAGKMEWTVRNFRLVKASTVNPPEWKVQVRKSKTQTISQPSPMQIS